MQGNIKTSYDFVSSSFFCSKLICDWLLKQDYGKTEVIHVSCSNTKLESYEKDLNQPLIHRNTLTSCTTTLLRLGSHSHDNFVSLHYECKVFYEIPLCSWSALFVHTDTVAEGSWEGCFHKECPEFRFKTGTAAGRGNTYMYLILSIRAASNNSALYLFLTICLFWVIIDIFMNS